MWCPRTRRYLWYFSMEHIFKIDRQQSLDQLQVQYRSKPYGVLLSSPFCSETVNVWEWVLNSLHHLWLESDDGLFPHYIIFSWELLLRICLFSSWLLFIWIDSNILLCFRIFFLYILYLIYFSLLPQENSLMLRTKVKDRCSVLVAIKNHRDSC